MDYPRAFVSFPRIAGSGNEIGCATDADSSTVPRYILVRENMPVRGLGVDSTRRKCEGLWNRVSKSWQNSRKLGNREKLTFLDESGTMQALENSWKDSCDELDV